MDEFELCRRDILRGASATALVTAPVGLSSAEGEYFAVSVSHSPDVVRPGDTSVVEGEVTNTGDERATQIVEIQIRRDGEVEERRSSTASLDPGETASRTEKFEYEEYPGPGEYVGEVCSADECATTTWTVSDEPPDSPFFAVDIIEMNDPVAGEPLGGVAEVTNTGDQAGSQSLQLTVDGLGEASTTVDLDGGESTTVSLSIPTKEGDAGEYTATVSSDDDSASQTVTVRSQTGSAFFAVDITETTTPTAGDPLDVTVEVTNTGSVSGNGDLSLMIGGLGEASTSFSLDAGATTTVSLSVPTDAGDAGEYTATVDSEDDSASRTVTVEPQPAFFTLDVGETTTLTAGEPLATNVEVTNTGGAQASKDVELAVEGLGADTATVSLDGGETTRVSLSVPTDAGDAGEYTATVSGDDDSTSWDVTIAPQSAVFEVEFTEASRPSAGDPLEVTVDVANTGGAQASQDVELSVEGLGAATSSINLAAGESTSVSLSVPTNAGDAGEYSATVSSDDDSASGDVAVGPQPAFFAVDITETTMPTAGEPLDVTAEVANTGGVAGDGNLSLSVEGLGEASTPLSLDAGETTTASLSVPTDAGDAGEYTATVSSDDESAARTVTVADAGTISGTPGQNSTDDASTDEDGAGFGVAGALASLTSGSYLLVRRLGRTDNE